MRQMDQSSRICGRGGFKINHIHSIEYAGRVFGVRGSDHAEHKVMRGCTDGGLSLQWTWPDRRCRSPTCQSHASAYLV